MRGSVRPISDPHVKAKFESYPPGARKKLFALRELIFRTAEATAGVGEIEESLKWGEPAYRTKNKAGTTIRIDWKKKNPDQYAMYFNCQTNLVEMFRTLFPNDFKFEGNRALVLELQENVPKDSLAVCIAESLTYHLSKRNIAQATPRAK